MLLRAFFFVACALWAAFGSAASAHEFKLGDLMIDHPWACPTIGKTPNGAAYMTLSIHGRDADRLLRAESAVAKRVELHGHLVEDGIVKMRPVEAIEIAAGEPTLLRPGGLHVMLMGLKAPLVEGTYFPLTLVFEHAGRLEVEVKVEAAAASEPPETKGHDHGS